MSPLAGLQHRAGAAVCPQHRRGHILEFKASDITPSEIFSSTFATKPQTLTIWSVLRRILSSRHHGGVNPLTGIKKGINERRKSYHQPQTPLSLRAWDGIKTFNWISKTCEILNRGSRTNCKLGEKHIRTKWFHQFIAFCHRNFAAISQMVKSVQCVRPWRTRFYHKL